MIADIINQFRYENGKERVFCRNPVENNYCFLHCLHMARQGQVEHTHEYLLKDRAEAVASCSFNSDMDTSARYLIFNVLSESEKHRDVLLKYDNLAYGIYLHNYKMYLTIRGWN